MNQIKTLAIALIVIGSLLLIFSLTGLANTIKSAEEVCISESKEVRSGGGSNYNDCLQTNDLENTSSKRSVSKRRDTGYLFIGLILTVSGYLVYRNENN